MADNAINNDKLEALNTERTFSFSCKGKKDLGYGEVDTARHRIQVALMNSAVLSNGGETIFILLTSEDLKLYFVMILLNQ